MIWNGVEPIRITPAGSAVGGQWSTCRSYLGHCGSGRIASSAWSCTRENPEKTTDVTGSTGSGSGSHLPDGALLFQVEIRGCEAFDDGDPARLQHFGVAFLCVDWTQGVGWSMVMQSEFIHYLSVITVGCEPHQFPRRIWQKRTTFREMIWQQRRRRRRRRRRRGEIESEPASPIGRWMSPRQPMARQVTTTEVTTAIKSMAINRAFRC